MLTAGRVRLSPCIYQAPCSLRAFRRIAPIGASNRRRVVNRRRVLIPGLQRAFGAQRNAFGVPIVPKEAAGGAEGAYGNDDGLAG